MNKKILNVIIFVVAVISCPVSLIVGWKTHSALWLLIAAFVIGYVIAEIIKFRNGNNRFDLSDIVLLVLPIILQFVPFDSPPFKEQLNRLYFPKDSIDFESEFVKPITSDSKLPKLIFAFDNSGAGLSNTIANDLQDRYHTYCKKIEELYGESKIDNAKKLVKNFYEKKTYGNFLKARLCFELIKNKNKDGEFMVLKIGDPSELYKNDGFQKLTEENIKNEIKKIIQTQNNEKHTDFDVFNDNLRKHTKKTATELSEYALYVYSDFYHDYDSREETEQDRVQIIKARKELLSNIVQNYFIDNHNHQKGVFILETEAAFPYENHFVIGKIDESEAIVPIRITEKKAHWYYSKDDNNDITTSFRLVFKKCDKKICSHNKIYLKPNHQRWFVNDTEFGNKEWTFFNSDYTNIILKYQGKKEPENKRGTFEIEHNDIHYVVYFDFIKEWDRRWKYWLPGITLIIGLLIGFLHKIRKK